MAWLAGLASGVAPQAAFEALVGELHHKVFRTDVYEPLEAVHDGLQASLALIDLLAGAAALGEVAGQAKHHALPLQLEDMDIDLHG